MGKGGVASVMVMLLRGAIKTFSELDAAPGKEPPSDHESDCQFAEVELFQTCAASGEYKNSTATSSIEIEEIVLMEEHRIKKRKRLLPKILFYDDFTSSVFLVRMQIAHYKYLYLIWGSKKK